MAGFISTISLSEVEADLDELLLEISHDSQIYPDDTNRKVEFTAGGTENTWSSWAEVEDDDTPAVTLSSKFVSQEGHISGILIEDLSHDDKRYELCIAYGDAKTCILTHRFLSGEVKKLAAIQFVRIRSVKIPTGETIYYRMKCEQPSATCEVSIRYHYHT